MRHELIDEQKRHSRLEIVQQLLQCRLLDFATCCHPDVAGAGLCPLQLHVR